MMIGLQRVRSAANTARGEYILRGDSMLNLMTTVRIISDTLAFGLPIDEVGYIRFIDRRNRDTGTPYYVRVPSSKEGFWMPECDLQPEEDYIQRVANEVINHITIDHSLATKNRTLFDAVMATKKESDA